MKQKILASVSVLVALAIGGLGVGYYVYQTSGRPVPQILCCTSAVNPSTYTASNPNLGIRLVISLNSSTIQLGGTINYSASVYNTRPTENNVTSASNWALPRLIFTACTSPTDSPIAYAIMQGRYDSGNISKAPSVNYGFMCSTVMGGVRVYSFQQSSDIASVIGNCSPNPCFTRPVSSWRPFNQYPSGGGPEPWVNFTTGVYTVVAEDEWGDLALVSFTVT